MCCSPLSHPFAPREAGCFRRRTGICPAVTFSDFEDALPASLLRHLPSLASQVYLGRGGFRSSASSGSAPAYSSEVVIVLPRAQIGEHDQNGIADFTAVAILNRFQAWFWRGAPKRPSLWVTFYEFWLWFYKRLAFSSLPRPFPPWFRGGALKLCAFLMASYLRNFVGGSSLVTLPAPCAARFCGGARKLHFLWMISYFGAVDRRPLSM